MTTTSKLGSNCKIAPAAERFMREREKDIKLYYPTEESCSNTYRHIEFDPEGNIISDTVKESPPPFDWKMYRSQINPGMFFFTTNSRKQKPVS